MTYIMNLSTINGSFSAPKGQVANTFFLPGNTFRYGLNGTEKSLTKVDGGKAKIPPTCRINPAKLEAYTIFCSPTFEQSYSAIAIFEYTYTSMSQYFAFFTDVSNGNSQLHTLAFNISLIGTHLGVPYNTTTSQNFIVNGDFSSWTTPTSHFLLNLDNTKLLLSVNSQVKIYDVSSDATITQQIFASLLKSNYNSLKYYYGLLFAATNGIDIYSVAQASTTSIPHITNIPAEYFAFGVTGFSIISMEIDESHHLLYALDNSGHLYALNLTTEPYGPHDIKVLTIDPAITSTASKVVVGGSNTIVLVVDDGTSSTSYELVQSTTDQTVYQLLRSREASTMMSIYSDGQFTFATQQNLVEVTKLGLSSVYSGDSQAMVLDFQSIAVKIAAPLHYYQSPLFVSADSSQICITQVFDTSPTVACSSSNETDAGTYLLEGQICVPNCTLKQNSSDSSPFSYCQLNFEVQLTIAENSSISSGTIGLIVGLIIGFLVFVVIVVICLRLRKQAKKYEKFRNETNPTMRERESNNERPNQDKSLLQENVGRASIENLVNIDLNDKEIKIEVKEN